VPSCGSRSQDIRTSSDGPSAPRNHETPANRSYPSTWQNRQLPADCVRDTVATWAFAQRRGPRAQVSRSRCQRGCRCRVARSSRTANACRGQVVCIVHPVLAADAPCFRAGYPLARICRLRSLPHRSNRAGCGCRVPPHSHPIRSCAAADAMALRWASRLRGFAH
jgi:hypothetical protein